MRFPLFFGLVATELALIFSTGADTLQLKDKASVSGRIVAEKPDVIFVDVGYSVIGIPRAQVIDVRRDNPGEIGRAHV